jgi:hypothetical protein
VNISRLMDCVTCNKCRLWGELQARHRQSHQQQRRHVTAMPVPIKVHAGLCREPAGAAVWFPQLAEHGRPPRASPMSRCPYSVHKCRTAL